MKYMIRVVQNPIANQYLERDTFGGPLRWSKRVYATRFSKTSAMRMLNTLMKQGEQRAIIEEDR